MGNKTSSPSVPSPVPLSLPQQLSERTAWTIATAWHPSLTRVLRLGTALPTTEPTTSLFSLHGHTFSIVESVEYIDFYFDTLERQDLERVVLAARCATIAWFALSCCPGFSGTENPEFWWRVLLMGKRRPAQATAASPPPPWTTDAAGLETVAARRFFPHAARPFPRLRFSLVEQSRALTVQLFLHGTTSRRRRTSSAEKWLVAVLHQLTPFIHDPRWQQGDLHVAVSTRNLALLVPLLDRTTDQQPRRRLHPPLRLATVYCHGTQHVERRDVDALVAADAELEVCFVQAMDVTTALGPAEQWLYPQQRNDNSDGHETTTLHRSRRVRIAALDLFSTPSSNSYVDGALYPVGCSAVPFTNAVTGLRVNVSPHGYVLTARHGAWLGFALFSPGNGSGTSSFTDLRLTLTLESRAAMDALASMAIGNNLLSTLAGHAMAATTTMPVPVMAYYEARVRAGTCVYACLADGRCVDDANVVPALFTLSSDAWVPVCLADPREAAQLLVAPPRPVHVVLPGTGLCWVLTSRLLDVRARAPAPSRVRRLSLLVAHEVFDRWDWDENARAVLTNMLAALGDRLVFLEVDSFSNVPPQALATILELCPNLTQLRVRHDGSYWTTADADPEQPRKHPRLGALELMLGRGQFLPLGSSALDTLSTLYVTTSTGGTFLANRPAFLTVLARYPNLRGAVWRASNVHLNFDELQHATATMLVGAITSGVHNVCRASLSVAARLAFLSVVRSRENAATTGDPSHHAMGRLGPDSLRTIFSFSTSVVPREVHIGDVEYMPPEIPWVSSAIVN